MGLVKKTKKCVKNFMGFKKPERLKIFSPAMGASKIHGYVSPSYSISKSVRIDVTTAFSNRCLILDGSAPEFEAYRLLRTKILSQMEDRGSRIIMVTSPMSGEGKTTTAINLALTFAREFNQTSLLVDCDLRKQDVHRFMGFSSDRNLVDYLSSNIPLSEIILWPGIEKFTVISGDRTIPGSGDILASPLMIKLVEDLRSRYSDRCIIFDMPPVIGFSDAVVFSALADYILVVAQTGKTTDKELKSAVDLLPKEKILGIVMNHHS
jgi:non-specific protein-tyrosine kinase